MPATAAGVGKGAKMAKYFFQASYTLEGLKALLEDGGTARAKLVEELVSGAGGKLEAFYYAFGDNDVYAIAELPDDATAAAVSLRVSAGGAVSVKTTVLLDPATIDDAAEKVVNYAGPAG